MCFLSGFDNVSLLNGVLEAYNRSLSFSRLCCSCGFLVTIAICVSKSRLTDRHPVDKKKYSNSHWNLKEESLEVTHSCTLHITASANLCKDNKAGQTLSQFSRWDFSNHQYTYLWGKSAHSLCYISKALKTADSQRGCWSRTAYKLKHEGCRYWWITVSHWHKMLFNKDFSVFQQLNDLCQLTK